MCLIDKVHTCVSDQTADCEVSTSVPNLIFVYQNARRHITDIKHLNTPKYNFILLIIIKFANITMLWIHGLTAMLLVQGREEMSVPPAVTAVPSHPLITI